MDIGQLSAIVSLARSLIFPAAGTAVFAFALLWAVILADARLKKSGWTTAERTWFLKTGLTITLLAFAAAVILSIASDIGARV